MQTATTSLDSASAIATLSRYHISEDHLPTGYTVARKEIILLILGLGGLNYVPVAYYNGNTVTMSIINAVTTAILGEVVLYISGKIYYDIKIAPQYVAEELQNVVQAPLTEKAFIQEVLAQVIFAAASAIPLATTLFDANLEIFTKNPWLFWLAFSYIEVVNTAMHLVPIELTMRDEFYGFLPRQLMRFYCWLTNYQPFSEEQERMAQLSVRAAVLCEINPILTNAKQNFLHDLVDKSSEEIQVNLIRYQESPDALLREMLACYVATPSLNPTARIMARIMGGLLVSGACLGYAANPYLVFKNDFHFSMEDAIGITILPIYFFMVLMTFFGDGNGVRALQDMLSLNNIFYQPEAVQKRLPTVAKFYPSAFAVVSAIILFVMAFAGAPGREMMKMAFEEIFPRWLMIVAMGVVDLGIGVLLTSYVLLDFIKIMFNYYAQYYGAEPQKNVAIIKAKIEALIYDFGRINPAFAKDLETYIKYLVPDVELEKLEQYKLVGSRDGRWCDFLRPTSQSEEGVTKKLLSVDEEISAESAQSESSSPWCCC